MLTTEEIEKEKEYLKEVITALEAELQSYNAEVKGYSDDIQEQMSYAWDKTNRLSDTEFVYALANIQKRSIYAKNANKKVKAYTKMLDNTYFARIDFIDDVEKDYIPIYIGISTLNHDDKYLVFDWRAPISSMFYNNEIGDASYEISSGEKVTGKIVLKRQYKISNGELVEVFDTDMQIIDNILKEILSSNASNKMKNIVKTIQKEQNDIIRKNDKDIFVIQGPAGSGKTSIAMHKIAYLLYSERDKIDNTNVMILSPNEIFNNYISDVLPGIGEDNVVQSTFMELAKAYINEFKISTRIEDIYEIVYSSKLNSVKDKINEIKFKYDPMYIAVLNKFIRINKAEILGLEEIIIDDDVIVDLDEIKKVIRSFSNNNESLYLEGKKIIDKIFNKASLKSNKYFRLTKLKKQVQSNLVKIKLKVGELYLKLYSDKEEFISLVKSVFEAYDRDVSEYDLDSIFELTSRSLSENRLEFQDVTPFMYLKSKIIGITANKKIKYVLIDEAQDYSLMQYKILTMLFKNSNLTLLGDLNQSILPFNAYDSYSDIISIIEKNKPNSFTGEYELSKTYRSTYEINNFAKKIITYKNSYNQIDRHGDEVKIISQDYFDAEQILNRAIELKKSYNTVAIICKNFEEVALFKNAISEENINKFRFVTKNDNVFVEEKIMIIPSYLSKGLEFDAVLVSNANDDYYTENDRKLFYVVVTRALHKLEIYYSGKFTNLYNDKNV